MGETALIDYGSGNIRSVARALEAAGAGKIYIGAEPKRLQKAERFVLPGVGALGSCLEKLRAQQGLLETLEICVLEKGQPFLGICVGMQVMVEKGFEYGKQRALGWLKGSVRRLNPNAHSNTLLATDKSAYLPVPHMGWNNLQQLQPHPLLEGVADGEPVYFVHSFSVRENSPSCAIAQAQYGGPTLAMLAKDSIVGVQFHPEKSQRVGQKILANFLAWRP